MFSLRQRAAGAAAALTVAVCLLGCYTVVQPTPPPDWTILCTEQIPALGDSLLSSGLFQSEDGVILLKVGTMLDKTRFTVDTDLLMKEMRTYLVNHGGRRIEVFDNDADVVAFCEQQREKRLRSALRAEVKYLAGRIVKSAIFKGQRTKIAVLPVPPISGGAINGDGLISLLRDEIALQGDGRIAFFPPEHACESDYLLRGKLVAFDEDLSLRIVFEKPADPGKPCFEVSMPVQKKLFDRSLDATYVLSGELNVLTRKTPGYTDDYLRMGFNVVDPRTKLHKWEGACKISVSTPESVLYH